MSAPIIESFFDPASFSLTYLVYDRASRQAIVIDPVLDFDAAAMRIDTHSAQKLLDLIKQKQLTLSWIFETHVHADHLTAAHWLKRQTNASIAIGENISQVQATFNQLFELTGDDAGASQHFDRLLKDGDTIEVGGLQINVLATPGHTPSCCTYVIGENAFVGDTIFMPDFGTARCDFPSGDARQLYRSLQKTLALKPETQLYMCHDYMPGGRELRWQTTVAEQKADNIHIRDGISEEQFVAMRTERDSQLPVPKLILPALQINMRAGRLPNVSEQGTAFLKLPINRF